jgi:hypothetical protein
MPVAFSAVSTVRCRTTVSGPQAARGYGYLMPRLAVHAGIFALLYLGCSVAMPGGVRRVCEMIDVTRFSSVDQ